MFSKKLVATLAVVAASAIAPAGAAAGTPERAVAAPGTQVGSEGVRAHPAPSADGIIAILIGLR